MNKYKVLLVLLSLFIITGCNNKEDPDILLKHIDYKTYETMNNELILYITNNNSVSTDIEASIIYYNNDEVVDEDFNYMESVSSKKEVILTYDLSEEEYTNYDIKLNVVESNNKSKEKLLTIYDTDNGSNIEVEINSKDNLEMVSVIVLFYKDNKVIGFDESRIPKLEKNKIKTTKLYYPYINKKKLDFDNYKVIINEAY